MPCRVPMRAVGCGGWSACCWTKPPGGLLARLRAQAWCDAVRLDYSRCSENNALLSFIFTVNHGSAAEAAHIESALLAWLQALQVLAPAQLAHYERLANRDFHRLAPLDQLRARAFGLPPTEPNDDWPRHIAALISAPRRRLAVRPDGGGEPREIQGLPLALGPFVGAALTPATEPFAFSPPRRRRVRPCLPAWRRCGICSLAKRSRCCCCGRRRPAPSAMNRPAVYRRRCAPGRPNWRIGRDI